jgi:hypothetical protein
MEFEPNFWRKWFNEWLWVLAQPAGLAVTFVVALGICAFFEIPRGATNFTVTVALVGYLIGYTVTYFLKEYTEKIWKKEAEDRKHEAAEHVKQVDHACKAVVEAQQTNQQLMLRIGMLRRVAEIRPATGKPQATPETKTAFQEVIESMVKDGLVTPRGANYLRKFLHLPEN